MYFNVMPDRFFFAGVSEAQDVKSPSSPGKKSVGIGSLIFAFKDRNKNRVFLS